MHEKSLSQVKCFIFRYISLMKISKILKLFLFDRNIFFRYAPGSNNYIGPSIYKFITSGKHELTNKTITNS